MRLWNRGPEFPKKDAFQSQANRWFELASEQGNPGALYMLGLNYKFGVGFDEDVERGFFYIKAAAEKNFWPSYAYLGDIYYEGEGAPEDLELAVSWYRKGAEEGDADAMYQLGKFHEFGIGVRKDRGEAARWYLAAAESGRIRNTNIFGPMN